MYVVAHNRDRDSYQIALALAEAGQLRRLFTDYYYPEHGPGRWFGRLIRLPHRRIDGISSDLVRWDISAIALQWLFYRLLFRFRGTVGLRSRVMARVDQGFGIQAAREAVRSGSDLLLYSGCALEAFARLQHRPVRKVLFVFHPVGRYYRQFLEQDYHAHGLMTWSHRLHLMETSTHDGAQLEREIELADEVLCASAFTAASVRFVAPGKKITVVPYGCKTGRPAAATTAPSKKLRILFVGQGIQRKGLHHLLMVWAAAAPDAVLDLVLSKIDPDLEPLLAKCRNATVRSRLTKAELKEAYELADVLWLPSLVEGFGLVLLEALSAGCFLVATPNTGLPDLGLDQNAMRIHRPGDLATMTNILAELLVLKPAGFDRARISAAAGNRTWTGFRTGIRQALVDQHP